ncbi:MAG: tetratricopeptide repeat protein [Acidimicrobiia bacterium]
MAAARRAFERERYPEAKRVLVQVVERAPTAVSARELLGMTLYRLGKWREAAVQLEAFRELTGSADQNPMLADCYRAMRRYTEADELWDELKAASPSAEVMAEGRIVKAGSLADRGQLREAISLIEKALRPTKVVHDYHVRQWYALGDLYDRAGDAPRARALFERVRVTAGTDFGDVGARLRALG